MASQESVVVLGALDDEAQAQARMLRLRLEPLSLQQVMVQAAGGTETTIDFKERTHA